MNLSSVLAPAARLLFPLCLAAPSLADVLYVDAGGNGHFTAIQPAIDAALDGDVLLVRTGIYGGFVVDQRDLSIVADAGAQVRVDGIVTVRNTAPNRLVLLAGLQIVGLPGYPGTNGLDLVSNAGHVRVQTCTIRGGDGWPGVTAGDGGHCTTITGSAKVVFAGCSLIGGDGGGIPLWDIWGGDGGHGAITQGSAVAFYDCLVQGGVGGAADYIGSYYTAGDGGDGCRVLDFGILASGCQFQGGMGGSYATNPGDGGDGLVVDAAQAQLIDNTYAGGLGGWGYTGNMGQAGVPQSGPGVFHTIPGAARKVSAPVLVPENSTMQFDLSGEPGDRVWLLSSGSPAFLYMPTYAGMLCVPLPSLFGARPLAVLPASGAASISIPTPVLGTGTLGLRRFWQGLAANTSGQFRLMSPAHVVVLNCSDLQPDCNGNLSCDSCDLLLALSIDCDKNGVPDECQADCNSNGIADPCDIASGSSEDLNHNGVPDECEPQNTWFVDDSASPGGNGSPGSPFQSLSQAFAVAVSGDAVRVADGLYQGPANRDLRFGDRELVVASLNGAANCVIDCQLLAPAFRIEAGLTSASRVEGFTIHNGMTTSLGHTGGGIYLRSSNAVIRNCTFENCRAQSVGGAIGADGGDVSIERCTFIGNRTLNGPGGAVWLHGGASPRVVDCEFIDNRGSHGGAVYLFTQLTRIERCSFIENVATQFGGAVYAANSFVSLDQCWISGNSSARGGGIADELSSWSVTNCTLSDNFATVKAGVAHFWAGNHPNTVRSFRNSVFWNNTQAGGTAIELGYGPLDVAWCDLQGGQGSVTVGQGSLTWGPGNIDLDPLFIDPDGADNDPLTIADNNYRLKLASPCIDAGANASVEKDWFDLDGDGNVTEPVPVDFDGAPRFVEIPSAPNTGSGAPPLVDFGAWERP